MKKRIPIVLLIVLIITARSAHTTQQTDAVPGDSVKAARTVVAFLNWYKTHIDAISRIYLVNQEPGKNYSVNSKKGEQYLAYLKTSNFLTDRYLTQWRTYFKERQAGFRASPQNEGPPDGFEYDLVLLSQDVEKQLASLRTLKINSVKVRSDRATVKLLLLFNYEVRLVKQNNRWLINEILNTSEE